MALFNKVGDLYQKVGNIQSAVDQWERGVDHYVDTGFHNNAIALCNKILRNAPARTHVYLKLAQLMVQRGFVSEAKQNLLEYAERMKKAGQLDAAFKALKEFADLSPDNEDIRLLLAEQLKAAARTDEAREQLAKLYHESLERGGERQARATVDKMKAIDPEYNVETAPTPKTKEKKGKSSDLVFLDLDEETPPRPAAKPAAPRPAAKPAAPSPAARPAARRPAAKPAAPPPLAIEPTSLVEEAPAPEEAEELPVERSSVEFDSGGVESGTMEGLMGTMAEPPAATPPLEFEPTALEEPAVEEIPELGELPALEVPEAEAPVGAGGLEVPELDLGGFGEEVGGEESGGAPELMELEIEVEPFAAAPPSAPPDVATLEGQVAASPDDAQLHKALGEGLLETGKRERALQELDIALGLFESKEDWTHAEDLTDEILRLDPNSVRHYQRQVEYAFRRNDKGRLIEAYLGLSDALMRSGAMERARAVYQRVLEHDPKNARALSALTTLEPPPEEKKAAAGPRLKAAPPVAAGDFVDLGALVMDDEGPRDARLRVQDEEPTGDEQRDFEDMLAQFKKGIDASLGADDVQAHYDLGVAFKEMGLIDEAIGEFQKALRGTEGRLRTSEALGTCFFEKGQYNVAATVLRRAVETDQGGDEDKIGLLYWLGRSEEEQQHATDALTFYQRVFAVDIGFQDVNERVKSLAKAGR